MLLVVTNSQDATSDFLCEELERSDVPYLRFNSDMSLKNLDIEYDGSASMAWDGNTIGSEEISNVWYRRPKPLDVDKGDGGDEAERRYVREEWSEAVEGFFAHVPIDKWMNHPTVIANASRKMEQLTRADRCGLNVPPTIVTRRLDRANAFWDMCAGDVIVKPISGGYIERESSAEDSVIYTSRVLESSLKSGEILEKCPTLFQKRVRKVFDVRITVVDRDMHAVALMNPEHDQVDIRRDNMKGVRYKLIDLPLSVGERLRRLVSSYGLRFAAIDMVVDEESAWWFLEINPNGQWAWTDIAGCSSISDSFVRSFRTQL